MIPASRALFSWLWPTVMRTLSVRPGLSKISDQDALLLEAQVQRRGPCRRGRWRGGSSRGSGATSSPSCVSSLETRCRSERILLPPAAGVVLVLDGRGGGDHRDRVAVVAVLDLHHLVDHVRLRHRVAEPQAGQRVGLAERAGDDDVLVLLHQRQAVVVGEVGVGLVHQHQAGEALGQLRHLQRRDERAAGGVGVGEVDRVAPWWRPARRSAAPVLLPRDRRPPPRPAGGPARGRASTSGPGRRARRRAGSRCGWRSSGCRRCRCRQRIMSGDTPCSLAAAARNASAVGFG